MPENTQATLPDIRQTITMNAPVQKVWDAVATSEGIAAWFMPNTFEPVLGHEFTLTSPFEVSVCKVTELDPPNRLVFSWGADWVITFELADVEGKTQFTLIHAGWKADKVEHGMPHAMIRDRMNHGWEHDVLPRLVKHVEA